MRRNTRGLQRLAHIAHYVAPLKLNRRKIDGYLHLLRPLRGFDASVP
jgi:hypothetical protein